MGLDTHMIAGSRACSTSTRPTNPTITNKTSPHYDEALPGNRPHLHIKGSENHDEHGPRVTQDAINAAQSRERNQRSTMQETQSTQHNAGNAINAAQCYTHRVRQ
jgi:hypothetical protein